MNLINSINSINLINSTNSIYINLIQSNSTYINLIQKENMATKIKDQNTRIGIFNEIVKARRSVRVYDQEASFDPDVVQRNLETATLAPNSSNLQLWEFYRVRDEERRKELARYCLDQSAAKTARELVVFVTRPDKWKERARFNKEKMKENLGDKEHVKKKINDYYGKIVPFMYRNDRFGLLGLLRKIIVFFVGMRRPIPREVGLTDTRIVTHKTTALAAQTFMLGVKAEGYDTCPMEGFDSKRVKKMLKLPHKAEVNMVVAVGSAADNGIYGPRIRVANDEVIHQNV